MESSLAKNCTLSRIPTQTWLTTKIDNTRSKLVSAELVDNKD